MFLMEAFATFFETGVINSKNLKSGSIETGTILVGILT